MNASRPHITLGALAVLATAACSDSVNDPESAGPIITVEAPGASVVAGMVQGVGHVELRGTVSGLDNLDRLAYTVDQQAERTVALQTPTGDEAPFAFAATDLPPGQHHIGLRAYDREGNAHAAPIITVDVVPAVRELDIPDEAAHAFPAAINEVGDVVGYWTEIEAPSWHAFLHRAGQTRRLAENDWRSVATDVNDHGDVVGYVHALTDSEMERPVLWRGTTSSTLFAQYGAATSINNDGVVSGGIFDDEDGPPRGFVLRGAQLTIFGEPGRWTVGADLNEAGHVAGSSQGTGGDMFGFVIIGGETRTLGSLGGLRTAVAAINDDGIVVGYSEVADRSTYRAYRERNGEMLALRTGDQRDLASYANAINDRGSIVGEMITAGGEHWAFISIGDDIVALEELLPDAPPLIAAYGISNRGEIAAVAISSTGWLRPVLIAVPGGPEAIQSWLAGPLAAKQRPPIGPAIAEALKAHRSPRLLAPTTRPAGN